MKGFHIDFCAGAAQILPLEIFSDVFPYSDFFFGPGDVTLFKNNAPEREHAC